MNILKLLEIMSQKVLRRQHIVVEFYCMQKEEGLNDLAKSARHFLCDGQSRAMFLSLPHAATFLMQCLMFGDP